MARQDAVYWGQTIGYNAGMARHRRFELEELANRPGTYFNPQTEVLVVVDDSPELDREIFNMEDVEGDEWVLVSDNVPIDESARDELLENFQVANRPGGGGAASAVTDKLDEELADDEEAAE
jgi:hypothetical protein